MVVTGSPSRPWKSASTVGSPQPLTAVSCTSDLPVRRGRRVDQRTPGRRVNHGSGAGGWDDGAHHERRRTPVDAASHHLPMIHHVHRSSIMRAHRGSPAPHDGGAPVTNVEPTQPRTRRRPTSTSEFGVGRREAHDASSFYARFTPPRLSDDSHVGPPAARDVIWAGDAREMDRYRGGGRQLGGAGGDLTALLRRQGVRGSARCRPRPRRLPRLPGDAPRRLRPVLRQARAGRADRRQRGQPGPQALPIPVAGTSSTCSNDSASCSGGRSSGRRAMPPAGSCAWGTYQRPGNPVLRDVSERIIVASKGRFDRAVTPDQRARRGAPQRGDDDHGRVRRRHHRRLGHSRRIGHPGRPPGTIPGGTAPSAHRALHLPRATWSSTRSSVRARRPSPRSGPSATTSDSTPTRSTSALAERRIAEERAAMAAASDGPARRRVTVSPGRAVPPAERRRHPEEQAVVLGRKASELATRPSRPAVSRTSSATWPTATWASPSTSGPGTRAAACGSSSSRGPTRPPDPGSGAPMCCGGRWARPVSCTRSANEMGPRGRPRPVGPPVDRSPAARADGAKALRAVQGDDRSGPVYDVLELLDPECMDRLPAMRAGAARPPMSPGQLGDRPRAR